MKKILIMTVLLLLSFTLIAQIDSIEYKQISLLYESKNRYKVLEDNEDGTTTDNKEQFTTKMQALKYYSNQGWVVIDMEAEGNTSITTRWSYLLKRKK